MSSAGIMPDPRKVSAVENWPTPQCVFEVRSFLGLANYFRRYIHNFSKFAAPLINLTKGDISKRKSVSVQISWTDEVSPRESVMIRDFHQILGRAGVQTRLIELYFEDEAEAQ
jgi:hypothetical protein